jgi:uncharacterized RDD family membrane protein YckC
MASGLPQDSQSGLPVGKEPADGSRSEAELGPVRSEQDPQSGLPVGKEPVRSDQRPESKPLLMPYPLTSPGPSVEPSPIASAHPTNEGVSHQSFAVATSGERLVSGLVDVIVVSILGAFYTSVFGTVQRSPSSISMSFNGATVAGNSAMFFQVVALGYFFVMERLMGGSIGKLAFGQRVVSTDYTKPTRQQLLIRTVFRMIDGIPFFIPNLLGFLVLQNNEKRQRLGDKYANTMVVKLRQGPGFTVHR